MPYKNLYSEKAITCHRKANRKYYIKNRQKILEKRQKILLYISNIKSVPCKDCNNRYPPYVMDFDHRDVTKKKQNVSKMIDSSSLESLLKEIKKCDIVCSNCHRVRTANQMGHYKNIINIISK